MPVYSYKARNPIGNVIYGEISASDKAGLERDLASINTVLISCTSKVTPEIAVNLVSRSLPDRTALAHFSSGLSQLLRDGVPLISALETLSKEKALGSLNSVLSTVMLRLSEGNTFSTSLAANPRVFDALFCRLISVGEQQGSLDDSLSQLSELLIWQVEFRRRVRKALAYPTLVMMILISALFYLLTVVVPQLGEFVLGIDGELPVHTKLLLHLSKLLSNNISSFIFTGIFGIVLTILIGRKNQRKPIFIDKLLVKNHGLGRLILAVELSRFTKNLSAMMNSKVELSQAMGVALTLVSNRALSQSLNLMQRQMFDGVAFHGAARSTGVFNNSVLMMLQVGESTGQIPKALDRVSDHLHKLSLEHFERIERGLGPAMVVVAGLFIIWMIVSVIGPVYTAAIAAGAAL